MKHLQKQEVIIFIIIISIAAFFRLYQLNQFPSGLYPDEAMNGNNAQEALDTGDFKLFYPENNGREGLFINIQALSIKAFGNNPWSLRLVSAIIGILTVIGLYLLTRELFEWRMAALASFMMAVSFWHVNFSRIGFRAIMVPLVLVFGFYFLWRGLKHLRKSDFLMAGILGGIGFYTYISYRIVPLIAVLVFLNYWWYLKKDFTHSDYEHARNKLLQGFALAFISMFIIALPIALHFWVNPADFLGRASGLSIFNSANPLKALANSTLKTLAMFNFSGDWNWRHNISGEPMLHWTLGIFFVMGFFKELTHWLKRKHGHFSTLHTLIISWFFIMLIPGFISSEAPHAIRTIGVLPIVMILAARGMWWAFDKLSDWYKAHDAHSEHERHVVVVMVMLIFLGTIGFVEYWRYFKIWGPSPAAASAFNQEYVDLANKINLTPTQTRRYILVNDGGVLVNGIPMPAQTVMFLTDTYTANKQKEKNIYYLTPEQFKKGQYSKNSIIIPLNDGK